MRMKWLAVATALFPCWATAQTPCIPTQHFKEGITSKFKEVPLFAGIAGNSQMLIVYLNAEKGTWTLVTHLDTKMTCVIASGKHGVFTAPKLGNRS